jgi:hypothetical protein
MEMWEGPVYNREMPLNRKLQQFFDLSLESCQQKCIDFGASCAAIVFNDRACTLYSAKQYGHFLPIPIKFVISLNHFPGMMMNLSMSLRADFMTVSVEVRITFFFVFTL